MIETILAFSLVLNIVFFFYSKWLIRSQRILEEEISTIGILIGSYLAHIRSVYELEMFYGDETLQALMNHGKEITEMISSVEYITLEEDEAPPPTLEIED